MKQVLVTFLLTFVVAIVAADFSAARAQVPVYAPPVYNAPQLMQVAPVMPNRGTYAQPYPSGDADSYYRPLQPQARPMAPSYNSQVYQQPRVYQQPAPNYYQQPQRYQGQYQDNDDSYYYQEDSGQYYEGYYYDY